MSDLFHERVPVEFIEAVWSVMAEADWHQYQILSKRPERMLDVLNTPEFEPLPHVWLGTSIEDSDHKFRLDSLRRVSASIRFLSIEPLLGPVGKLDLRGIHWVIVGGESGPKARRLDRRWVDEVYEQCRRQDVPFFFKQWGGTNKKSSGREYRGRTWNQYPAELSAA